MATNSTLRTSGQPTLVVTLEHKRPIELVDFTASLTAFGQAYEDFVVGEGYDHQVGNVRLYIRELRSGSIIAELQALAEQTSFVLKHLDVYAGFVANLNELTNWFLTKGPERTAPSKKTATRLSQIIEPVAKDGSAQLFVDVGGVEISNHFHVNSEQANAVQNQIRRFVGDSPPSSSIYQDQVMYLAQLRGDASSKAGDRGVIERFSDKPVKLLFASEDVKRKILDLPDNPFGQVFVVDCEAHFAEGKPALYKIYNVTDVIEKP